MKGLVSIELEGESSKQYVTVLHSLAENCNYGNLKHEMIRDRIVVGIRDTSLSERLKLDPELTLEKATTTTGGGEGATADP